MAAHVPEKKLTKEEATIFYDAYIAKKTLVFQGYFKYTFTYVIDTGDMEFSGDILEDEYSIYDADHCSTMVAPFSMKEAKNVFAHFHFKTMAGVYRSTG